jgi:hypothetical protein
MNKQLFNSRDDNAEKKKSQWILKPTITEKAKTINSSTTPQHVQQQTIHTWSQ